MLEEATFCGAENTLLDSEKEEVSALEGGGIGVDEPDNERNEVEASEGESRAAEALDWDPWPLVGPPVEEGAGGPEEGTTSDGRCALLLLELSTTDELPISDDCCVGAGKMADVASEP